jgi:N-sulfoglucosamine sulfohydrolase
MDHTVIVVVSDHGMPFPFAKSTVYHNGPWCPVLLHYPGMGAPQVRDELTSSLDIMPTLFDILKVSSPGLEGQSWIPLLHGEKQDRDHVFVQVTSLSSGKFFPQRLVQTKTGALLFSPWADGRNAYHSESMTGLTYKAMVAAGKSDPKIQQRVDQYIKGYPIAYYDLAKDPDQRHNAIDDPAYQDEVSRLQALLLDHMQKTDDPQLENFQTLSSGGKILLDINTGESQKV